MCTGEEQEPAGKKKVVYGRKKPQPKTKATEAEAEAQPSTAPDADQSAEVQAAAEADTAAAQAQAEEAKAQAQQAKEQQEREDAEVSAAACKYVVVVGTVWSNKIFAKDRLTFLSWLPCSLDMYMLFWRTPCCLHQHLGPGA